MTEQEIIDMAELAGVTVRGHYDESGSTPQELLRFAKLVAKKEREACAKVCDSAAKEVKVVRDKENELVGLFLGHRVSALELIASAIRARGEKENNHG